MLKGSYFRNTHVTTLQIEQPERVEITHDEVGQWNVIVPRNSSTLQQTAKFLGIEVQTMTAICKTSVTF